MRSFIVIGVIACIVALISVSCRKDDKTAPVISLKGDAAMVVVLNTSYTDQGATAQDNEDGALNVNVSGTVDPDLAGTYVIHYSATDAAGNTGNADRVVTVRNDAYTLAGQYATRSVTPADTVYYTANVAGSTTLNRRIWLLGFAGYSQAVVFADLHVDSLFVPQQDATFGTPAVTRSFNGAGCRSFAGDTMVVRFIFNETTSGSEQSGEVIYKRPL